MEARYQELKNRLIEVNNLNSANALLYWDLSTYMPSGGAAARARQSATLSRLAHEQFTDPSMGRLLDDLRPYEESLGYDSDEASLIRVARREFERAVKVPSDFVSEMTSHQAESFQVWTTARPENDFARVAPYLEKTLDLSRRYAEFFPGYEHIADPLIDVADYGMKASRRSLHNLPPTTLACTPISQKLLSGRSIWILRDRSGTTSSAAAWTRRTTHSRPSSPSVTCASPPGLMRTS
jgi:carboxypeptidase Taq